MPGTAEQPQVGEFNKISVKTVLVLLTLCIYWYLRLKKLFIQVFF